MNPADEAKSILVYYFRLLAHQQGLHWNKDNDTEVSTVVDLIISAVKS